MNEQQKEDAFWKVLDFIEPFDFLELIVEVVGSLFD